MYKLGLAKSSEGGSLQCAAQISHKTMECFTVKKNYWIFFFSEWLMRVEIHFGVNIWLFKRHTFLCNLLYVSVKIPQHLFGNSEIQRATGSLPKAILILCCANWNKAPWVGLIKVNQTTYCIQHCYFVPHHTWVIIAITAGWHRLQRWCRRRWVQNHLHPARICWLHPNILSSISPYRLWPTIIFQQKIK